MFTENTAHLPTISRSCERPYRVLLAWWHCATLFLVVCFFLLFLEKEKNLYKGCHGDVMLGVSDTATLNDKYQQETEHGENIG
jgi:hypothetical protein